MTRYEELLDLVRDIPLEICVEWEDSSDSVYGHVIMSPHGRKSVHCVVAYDHHGPRPSGFVAAHLCGSRRCVNPAHIDWVSAQENLRHRTVHGNFELSGYEAVLKIQELQESGVIYLDRPGWRRWRIENVPGVKESEIRHKKDSLRRTAAQRAGRADEIRKYHREYMRAYRARKRVAG